MLRKYIIYAGCCITLITSFTHDSMAASMRTEKDKRSHKELHYQGNWDFLFMFGVQQGGDELTTVTEDQTDVVVDRLEAGAFFNAQIGTIVPVPLSAFSLQLTYGIIYDRIYGNLEDGQATFRRQTGEGLLFYNWSRYRFGLGVSYHFETKLTFQIPNQISDTVYFDNTLAKVVQMDVHVHPQLFLGLRYSNVTYEPEGTFAFGVPEVRGSAFGVHALYHF